MGDSEIMAFVAERNEVLRSGDVHRVMAFHAKMNPGLRPMTEHVATIAMHKARIAVTTFTESEKALSRAWLTEHGYSDDFRSIGVRPDAR